MTDPLIAAAQQAKEIDGLLAEVVGEDRAQAQPQTAEHPSPTSSGGSAQ